MKWKQRAFALFAVGIGFLFSACEKDIPEPLDFDKIFVKPQVRDSLPWTVENGTLVFLDDDHLNQALQYLSEMDMPRRLFFEDSLGFQSLRSIEHLILQDEEQRLETFFAGVPDSLSVTEYHAMGLYYTPGTMYQAQEQAGVIETITEPDSSTSFELTVKASGMHNVLNSEGQVIVGDIRYSYHDSIRDAYSMTTGELLESTGVGKQAGVLTNYNKHWHIGGSKQSSNKWAWIYPCSDKQRIAGKVKYSSELGSDKKWVRVDLVVEVKAQNKKVGVWAKRDNFRPFTQLQAAWDYRYAIIYDKKTYTILGSTHHMPNMGYATSPLNKTPGGTNEFELRLHPAGYHALGYQFADNVELLPSYFTFTFDCVAPYTVP